MGPKGFHRVTTSEVETFCSRKKRAYLAFNTGAISGVKCIFKNAGIDFTLWVFSSIKPNDTLNL